MQKFTLIFITILLLTTSCQEKKNRKWLDAAYPYIYYKPDSIHFYLNKIKNPEKLPEQEKALYNYISGLANIRVWNNTNSSAQKLEQAIQTFIQEKDSLKIVHGAWELARHYQQTGDFEKSDSLLKKGIEYASTPDQRISYNQVLSMNHLHRGNTEKALFYNELYLQEALPASPGKKLGAIGDRAEIYLYSEQPDSAFFYFDQALQIAYEHNYISSIVYYHKKRSELYSRSGNSKQAFIELQKSNEYDKSKYSRPHYLFLKAKIHLSVAELDSAIYYMQKAVRTPDAYVAARAYEYLSHGYHLQNNDSLALATLHLYNAHFEKLNPQSESNTIRYREDILKFENKELKLLKKQRELFILLISSFAILLCSLIYIIYIKEKKKKQQKEEELTRERLENHVKQLEQEKEVSILKERATKLREQIFRQLSVSQKIPSLSKDKNSTPEYKSKLTPEDLKELIETVNTIWPGFSERLQKNYPALKEKEIAFCCLIKCGITTKDLSNIYYVTPSAISQKKNRIKKEKFAINDETLSLDEILKET